jgi:OFA family oxalate/formate antiporter-like MFS transporter
MKSGISNDAGLFFVERMLMMRNRGWIVALAGLGVNLCLGSIYAWGVFGAVLRLDYNWTATQTQIPYMAACLFFAMLMVPGGLLQDRFGPRKVLTASAILAGCGFFLSGLFLSVWGLVLFFGVFFGTAIGLGYSTVTPTAVKWFGSQQRGLISGIVVGGFGLSAFFIAPLAKWLLDVYGISRTFQLMALVFAGMIFLLSRLIENPPAGLVPVRGNSGSQKDMKWVEMVRTPQFYCLWLMLFFGVFAGLLVIGQLTSIGREQAGLSVQASVTLVSVYALCSFIGRIGCGYLSDKFDRKSTLAVVFLVQALCYVYFPGFTTVTSLFAGTAVVAFVFGGTLSIMPVLACEYFGVRNLGLNYGIIYTAWGVSGLFGPLVGGLVRDLTGTYSLSYQISAVLSCLGLLLVIMIKVFWNHEVTQNDDCPRYECLLLESPYLDR